MTTWQPQLTDPYVLSGYVLSGYVYGVLTDGSASWSSASGVTTLWSKQDYVEGEYLDDDYFVELDNAIPDTVWTPV